MKSDKETAVKQSIRVLVVEDNTDDSDLLVRQLQKNNFGGFVKVIPDGKQAWDLLTAPEGISNMIAIFLDLNLPSMTGTKLLGLIKGRPELRAIPVFIMTSSNNPKDMEECSRLGVDGYISKPVTYTAFAKAVADLFHSSSDFGYVRVE